MKPDEQRLLAAVATMHPADNVRDVIVATGINRKRAHYLLEKWSNKGWYDYGVAVDLGWLEADGYRAADELAAQ